MHVNPIYQPKGRDGDCIILPDMIWFSIIFKISEPSNFPVRGRATRRNTQSIHQPHGDHSTRMLPDKVHLPITIHITHIFDLPVGRHISRNQGKRRVVLFISPAATTSVRNIAIRLIRLQGSPMQSIIRPQPVCLVQFML